MDVKIIDARNWVLTDLKGNTLVLVQVGAGVYKLFKYAGGQPDLNRFSDEEFGIDGYLPHWLDVTDQHLDYWGSEE